MAMKDALHAGIPIVFAAAEAESFGSIVAQGVNVQTYYIICNV
ncbi:MAG: hypothetical protein ACLRM9_07460 [Collinsella aerofaciens]